MSVKDIIETKINENFNVHHLHVSDESAKHEGHMGWSEQGETHFNVTIISPDFHHMSRIQRHQSIYKLLKNELDSTIHALALKTLTPEEAKQ